MKTILAILLFAFSLQAQDKIIATPDGAIGDQVHLTFSDGTMDTVMVPPNPNSVGVLSIATQVPHIIYDRYVPLIDWKTDPQKIIADVKTYLDQKNQKPTSAPPDKTLAPVQMTTSEIVLKQSEIIAKAAEGKSVAQGK